MPQVVVEINGRSYTLQCDDGQEEHLRRLARMVDEEIAAIREATGPLGDIRLLIMASLVLADRIHELHKQLAAASNEDAEKAAERLLQTVRTATDRLTLLTNTPAQPPQKA